ncbi:MAG: hypothetical protein ACOCWL_01500 [Thermoguttaceae bacterium]
MQNPNALPDSTYFHTQKGPWHLILCALAVVFFGVSWFVPDAVASAVLLVVGLAVLVLARAFKELTVADEGDQLAVRFGPLPLFQKRIRYDDIRIVERGRTSLLDGWGIHWNPSNGWVWNIWGRDCIVLRLERGILRIGTDDREGLADLLKRKLSGEANSPGSHGRQET